jgi:hypothetical protein
VRRSDLKILGADCAYDHAMQTRWKILALGLLAFQWVQTYTAWKLMDAIRYQAEGSWLHETAWGPEHMSKVWVIGGLVTALAAVLLIVDLFQLEARSSPTASPPLSGPPTSPPPETPPPA